MNSLQEIVKNVSKQTSTKKNAAFYNKERTECIRSLSTNENSIVREAIATNDHTPTTILKEMLEREEEKNILKAVLLHPNLPVKSILSFVSTNTRSSMFDDDDEIIDLVKQAVS